MMSLDSLCVCCGEPFPKATPESVLCPDCAWAVSKLKGTRDQKRAAPKQSVVLNALAVLLLVGGCFGTLLILAGWIWSGIEAVRAILGG